MHTDAHALPLTIASAEAAQAYNHAIAGYLAYAADAGTRIAPLLAADPEAPMAHTLAGSFAMLAFRADALPRAAAAAARATALGGTPRERAHAAALTAWSAGDTPRAMATWEAILADTPQDILAFRLHHFTAFWSGAPERMLASVEATAPRFDSSLPGYGTMLACRAFAHEEAGLYTTAEAYGRAAIARDPANIWAAHAVAHVLEMQGRRREGTAWIAALQPHWTGANNLKHHLWWHEALYALELGDTNRVLALYDTAFRNLASPLTQAAPDLYIDAQNAASMLFRLALRGVDPGPRWAELADHAEAHIGDLASPFTLPHWMMALTGAGRLAAAERFLEPLAASDTPVIRDAALPACRAILQHARHDFSAAVDTLRPALGKLPLLGGSHAQQDVLFQLFLDAALRADRREDALLALERAAARCPIPLARRAGYAEAANALGF